MKIKNILNLIPLKTVYAHCDIPCGIYDPNELQLAAHTVLRMSQLFEEHKENIHDAARIIYVKEKHGKKVEDEVGTLQNDYFKKEHFEEFPELDALLNDAVKLSITCRQKVDINSSQSLLEKSLQIAEIFYKTKGVTPIRVTSVYPTKLEFVTYK